MPNNRSGGPTLPPYLSPSGRDMRLDFVRGIVMWILIINHFEIFSYWDLLVWERVGVVSGGEGFVIISGIVLGKINRIKLSSSGLKLVVNNCIDRASQLYRVNVFVIVSVLALHLVPFINAAAAMTFQDRGAEKVYPLYPALEGPIQNLIAKILLLRCGPHQFQIMGLYVILVGLTPLILWAFYKKRTYVLLAISWLVYFHQLLSPSRPTQAQFEYGFPVLAWQLIFIHGLAVGYYWNELADWLNQGKRKIYLLTVSAILFAFFLFFTLHNPNPKLPEFMKLHFFSADVFHSTYHQYFRKNQLGILRLLNYAVVLILGIGLLSRYWKWWDRFLGWFFIPLGQATLYAFIIHVYLIILFDQFGLLSGTNALVNTLIHTLALASIWLCVRFKLGFRWIPR